MKNIIFFIIYLAKIPICIGKGGLVHGVHADGAMLSLHEVIVNNVIIANKTMILYCILIFI